MVPYDPFVSAVVSQGSFHNHRLGRARVPRSQRGVSLPYKAALYVEEAGLFSDADRFQNIPFEHPGRSFKRERRDA